MSADPTREGPNGGVSPLPEDGQYGAPPPGRVADLLFATMFPHAVVALISLAPPVMAAAVIATYGFSPELTGVYSFMVFAFALVTTLLSPPLIARFGPLRLSAGCLLLAGLGMAVFGMAGVPGLIVGGMLIGLAYGPMTPASSQALSSQTSSPRFSLIISIRQTSVPIGGVLAGLLVPWLVVTIGWSKACLVLAGAATLGVLVFLLLSPALRRERPAGRARGRLNILQPIRFIISRRRLLTLSCASTMFAAVQLIASSFMVIYLVTVVGHDLVTAGALLSASQAAGILCRPLWGHVADRAQSGRRLMRHLGFGMAASCLLMAGLANFGAGWPSLPVAVLFGATAAGWNGVFLAEVMRELEPEHIGPAISGALIFTYLGIALGPLVFGALANAMELAPAFAVVAVLVGLTAMLLLRKGQAPRAADGLAPLGGRCRVRLRRCSPARRRTRP